MTKASRRQWRVRLASIVASEKQQQIGIPTIEGFSSSVRIPLSVLRLMYATMAICHFLDKAAQPVLLYLCVSARQEVSHSNHSRRSPADKNALELERSMVPSGDFRQRRAGSQLTLGSMSHTHGTVTEVDPAVTIENSIFDTRVCQIWMKWPMELCKRTSKTGNGAQEPSQANT